MNFFVIFFGAWVLIMTMWMGFCSSLDTYYSNRRLLMSEMQLKDISACQEAAAKQVKLDSCGGK